MKGWVIRRALQAAVTFAAALALLFVLMRVAPGDPLLRLDGDRPISPREVAALRARYGLDQPLGHQFASFLGGVVRGDLGVSI